MTHPMRTNTSRRSFLGAVSGLAASAIVPSRALPLATSLAGMAAMATQSSHAATTGGYKALVCLYLSGGSDTHNWVVPVDASGYAEYAKARGELAWGAQQLQSITAANQGSGRSFGMPLELAPLRDLYEAGQAAIVANVGPLVRPITRAEYTAGIGIPAKLFSHNDQASTWQSLATEGAPSGWGGRMGDVLMSANANPVFTAVSASGNAVFLAGNQVSQYQVGQEGPVVVNAMNGSTLFGSSSASMALKRAYSASATDRIQQEYARVMQRSQAANSILQTALAGVNVPAIPSTAIAQVNAGPTTLDKLSLARQLRMVMQMIAANQALGMRRQVFMVQMGGFDTHNGQMRDQPTQMAQVAQSIGYFMSALTALGLQNNVTLFTASDFGRTLLSNGDGSDHGWGSHHFVVGGAVKGRQIAGQFPNTALGTANDIGSGRLLPSLGVTQMASSLASWMGLSSSEQQIVLPNLANFEAGPTLF
ncbi:Tat pathway signal protein [Pelomonas sp. HMWF004]|nr:Tat pathway signal protein [Pelomonas sp. HMWF004]